MPETQRNFLNVARSATGLAWRARLATSRDAEAIRQRHDVPELLARVLAGREVGLDEVPQYLNPTLRDLMPDPSTLRDMDAGAARIADAITAGEAIGVIGDYDVDGVSSTALFKTFLNAAGSDCAVHIPHRVAEGYGPSEAAVESLAGQGTRLLVTLDCGVMAHDPLGLAARMGLDTVIVDHHQAGEELPEALAVINPNRPDDLSGLGYLAAGGVTMLLIAAVNRELRRRGWWSAARPEPKLVDGLDLVALATVCDVVPLKGLNRAFVVQGLKVMANRERAGLAALADAARLRRWPDTHALGFVLGPRLNAAGRVGHANTALDLLLARDRGAASELAQRLEALNRERQDIELRIVEAAIAQAESALGQAASLPVLVVSGETWHPGVLGLVAARLKERFKLPAIALGYAAGDVTAAGSGRSIPGVDLGRAVHGAVEAGVIEKGGGHAMAAGLTVRRDRIGALRAFLEDRLSGAVETTRADASLIVDGALSAGGATLDLIEMLERAGPYGAGNPSPVFAFPAHRVVYADAAGQDHVRCTLLAADGSRLKAIAFRSMGTELGELLLSERAQPIHVAGRLAVDDWNGSRKAQLLIADAAVPVSQ